MALHRAPKYDLIGPVPKHRVGVKMRHKAINVLAKPAAVFDAAHNQPMNKVAMARKTGVHVAQAVAHVGGMLLLAKSLDGHDAFEVSKGMGPAKVAALTRVAGGGQGRAETIYARGRLKLMDTGAASREPAKTKARVQMKNALSQKSPHRGYGKTYRSARTERQLP